MLDLLKTALPVLKVKSICACNNAFILHCKVTVFILVLFSLLITQKQYFGDPIDCHTDNKLDLIDTFCWIQSTYTLPQENRGPYPGIGNPHSGLPSGKPLEVRYHSYYQWVGMVICLQALMFYFPLYLWGILEAGKLKMLIEGMNLPILDDDKFEKKKDLLISFFKMNLKRQNSYAYKFFLCELLAFINVVSQMYITDAFLGYEFTTYGTKVLQKSSNEFIKRNDALERVFPKVTKCTYHYFGPSGTSQILDAICILPLNVINEKVYIFLWFWFILVAVVCGLAVVYRLVTFSPSVRRVVLKARGKTARVHDLERINEKCEIGDWFLLTLIAKNMEANAFRTFITDLAKQLSH